MIRMPIYSTDNRWIFPVECIFVWSINHDNNYILEIVNGNLSLGFWCFTRSMICLTTRIIWTTTLRSKMITSWSIQWVLFVYTWNLLLHPNGLDSFCSGQHQHSYYLYLFSCFFLHRRSFVHVYWNKIIIWVLNMYIIIIFIIIDNYICM